jgi:hypothetical protein
VKTSSRTSGEAVFRSVEDVDDHAPVDPHRGRLGDRPDRVGDPSPLADHAAEVALGDADLVDEVASLFQLLDHDRLRLLDEGLDEELEQLRHRGNPASCRRP